MKNKNKKELFDLPCRTKKICKGCRWVHSLIGDPYCRYARTCHRSYLVLNPFKFLKWKDYFKFSQKEWDRYAEYE